MSANSKNKEEAYNGIKELVEKFKSNYKQFHSSDYNETLTRQDFINPFFEYLGWDISNKEGLSQTYRDVIHEDKLKIGKETKAPDYSFRIGGNRVFFVEAKKPSRNLKEDADAAYQIRRYAWSGKLAVSILTDFEEFAIYDCSKKPSPNDKASMSRIEYINYEDYLNRFDFLYDTFAKENVLRGSLEKYNADTKSKKGTESVDIDFLNSLDDLRTKLASNISKLNSLSLRDLNFAVQHIIDRIIFLRVAEDRGVENYGDLREACSNLNKKWIASASPRNDNTINVHNDEKIISKDGNNYYKNIVEIFKKADGKYNSGIFDFSKDKITQNIEVDNKVIKEIINDLYYPKSPYEFSVISVEIIGNAYEQFLGKTITIGNNSKAKIELKPEVRKAGGVYYTPEYIVDYIVENTVGEKIKGKKPKEIANIKIVDPACGSGSFLIGAYKYLLNYHREYYSKQGKKKFLGSKEDAITEDGELALWVKKQILINNIFGVDIDSNAVEVTKLSLLLKCMENETPASIINNQSLFNERALPSLDENIKCGNSLIGNDFYSGGDSLNIDIETQYKINCFDWNLKFRDIMKSGGFDVVIGNPPWGSKEVFSKIELPYIDKKFNRSNKNLNIFALFIDKSFEIVNDNYRIGLLIPKNFVKTSAYKEYRESFIYNINCIVDFGKFPGVAQECISLFIDYDKKEKLSRKVFDNGKVSILSDLVKENILLDEFKVFTLSKLSGYDSIIEKMQKNVILLGEHFRVFRGMEHGRNGNLIKCPHCNHFFERPGKTNKDLESVNCKYCKKLIKIEPNSYQFIHKEHIKNSSPLLIGNSIDRYILKDIQYFIENNLEGIDYKDLDKIDEKLFFIRISKELRGYYDNEKLISLNALNIVTKKDESPYDLKYILSILNSKLYKIYADIKVTSGADLTIRFSNEIMNSLPIPKLDMNNKQDKEIHDKLVNLVDNIIDLNKKLSSEKNPNTIEMLNTRIQAVDAAIDKIVYSLYNLTDEEIRVIEGE